MRKARIIIFTVIVIMAIIVMILIGKFIYENGKPETAIKIANETLDKSIGNDSN